METLVSQEGEGADGYAFRFDWQGMRTPEYVTVKGDNRKVQYMRDGIILFVDGASGTYMRLSRPFEGYDQAAAIFILTGML